MSEMCVSNEMLASNLNCQRSMEKGASFRDDVLRLPDLSAVEEVRRGEMVSQILSGVFPDKNEAMVYVTK